MTQGHSILRLQERRRHWKHQHGNKWTLLVAIIMRLQKEEKLGVIYVTKMLCGTPRPPYIFSYERITSRNFAVKPPIHYISTKMETVVGFIFKGFCAYLNLFWLFWFSQWFCFISWWIFFWFCCDCIFIHCESSFNFCGFLCIYPIGNYIFKINNRNTRTRCEIFCKLTIGHWRLSDVFIVNFGHISHLVLVFLLLILRR